VNPSKIHRLSWLLLLLAVGACARCGKPEASGDSALTHVPAEAEVVAWVPELGVLSERLMSLKQLELLDFVAPLLRARDGETLLNGLLVQAGVDARSREGLTQAGLDPDGDLAIALLGRRATLLVLPVGDAKVFEATMARVADQLFGASEVARGEEGGLSLVRFTRTGGTEPLLTYARVGRHAVLANGADPAQLVAWAGVKGSSTMQASTAFTASRERLSGKPVAWVFARGCGRWVPQGTVEGATVALDLDLEALTARLDVPWPDARTGLGALVPGKTPDPKLGLLPASAFAVVQSSGDLSKLGELWPWLTGQRVARAAESVGLDVQKEILGNLKPGAVMSLSLSEGARMDAVPSLSPRLNPFSWTRMVAIADVSDAAMARQTLAKLPPLAPRLAFRMTPADWDGVPVWLSSWTGGEGVHLALVKNRLVAAAPESALRDAVAAVSKDRTGGPPVDKRFAPLFEGHAIAGVVDLHRLAASVRELPPQAWGIGGFALKPTTVRWLDALAELRAVTFTVDAKGQAVQAQVSLVLQVEAR